MNSVLFAVTREDYLAELSLVEGISAEKVLCICSGGCTPLNLKAVKPQLSVSAFDLNPVQLTHVAQKISAVKAGELKKLNLNESGNALDQSVNQVNLHSLPSVIGTGKDSINAIIAKK